jgi:flagellar protein FlaI
MDQVINALRMRPERIILGELRGAEAQRLFAGANLGIPFATTMHSNERGTAVIKRLHSPPMSVPTESLSQLDLVISMNFDGGRIRRVMELSELCWSSRGHYPDGVERGGSGTKASANGLVWRYGDEQVFVNPLYEFNYACKAHVKSARYPSRVIEEVGQLFGMKKKEVENELQQRATLIKLLTESGRTGFLEFGRAVQEYMGGSKSEREELVERLARGGEA